MVRHLLRCRACPTAVSHDGKKPSDLANTEVIQDLLLKMEARMPIVAKETQPVVAIESEPGTEEEESVTYASYGTVSRLSSKRM